MGGKASAPAPPDYSALAAASERAAESSMVIAREQLDWAREQYFLDRDVADMVIESALERMERNDQFALRDRERYERIFQPLEEDLVADAERAQDPWEKERRAGMAQADVSQQFEAARQNAAQRLEGFGVDPSQIRAGALDIATRTQEAAARASAGNQARDQQENIGRVLRSEAINVGRGYPGQVAGAFGTAINSGNQAVNSGIATSATGGQNMGNPAQWQGTGVQAINGWWSGQNQMYANQVAAFDAENRANAGAMQLPGMILGGITRMATGGMFGASGGAVPEEASPSRGAITDDVPARIQVGEFIVPEDTVRWVGEKSLHSLIEKSQRERQEMPQKSGAIPEVRPVPNEQPTFQSRPAALPVG